MAYATTANGNIGATTAMRCCLHSATGKKWIGGQRDVLKKHIRDITSERGEEMGLYNGYRDEEFDPHSPPERNSVGKAKARQLWVFECPCCTEEYFSEEKIEEARCECGYEFDIESE